MNKNSCNTFENIDNKITEERRVKLQKTREKGFNYPNNFIPTDKNIDLIKKYNKLSKEELKTHNSFVRIAGRVMLKRIMGSASFINIQDDTDRIQVYLDKKKLDVIMYDNFKQFDIGDIVAIEGTIFKTNKEELSIYASSINLLSKSIRPLPDKFHGISDHNIKYRQRYLDIIMSKETRDTFQTRSKIISYIRNYMSDSNFMEVETPMLHPIPGGAAAKPFVTHHNALNMDMYLRIAPELYLKRLIVGGFERVFELNRNFRNEGVSPKHNPEFTMMEFYAAYTDYNWLMTFTEKLIKETVSITHKKDIIPFQNQYLDFSKKFEQLDMCDAICKYNHIYDKSKLNDHNFLCNEVIKINNKLKLENIKDSSIGQLQLYLFEETTEEKIWNPTYIINYPKETSPLARTKDQEPEIAERFELFIAGREIANGFSELNDPEEQFKRLSDQVNKKNISPDEENLFFDLDYVKSLEYGMPPTGGCGIGIDRLLMILTNKSNIRDIILFPHMRPE
ncbi:class II lysyl-tRNA synthetase [Candidatus Kinetoplastibacterium desouzaii TCC079E]|uniref:Lysine--tRNA ligase n=1 Tax=Candidatus Kinetoplastidibacterium desouzai TCC079E TaxID=1208919 RepID=M1LRP7_9PROT|nr:lysine--tRNA ligase [Candidatus Kinetoplastibacterium desouzaii]AGF46811.1 class II lysyl-tRNA synthetase [Candidatus Kinetoplastibacterium desouzaii TCC079E]